MVQNEPTDRVRAGDVLLGPVPRHKEWILLLSNCPRFVETTLCLGVILLPLERLLLFELLLDTVGVSPSFDLIAEVEGFLLGDAAFLVRVLLLKDGCSFAERTSGAEVTTTGAGSPIVEERAGPLFEALPGIDCD